MMRKVLNERKANMTTVPGEGSAITKLRGVLAAASKNKQIKAVIDAKDEVLAQYQPVFALEHIPALTEDEFRSFLLFKNNRHWTGLARKGISLCGDMPLLRQGLSILVDDNQPIKQRFDKLIPKGKPPFMDKLGRALLTAILHVAHPDKYGVYNGTSEAGMKSVGVLPAFERGSAFSDRYVKINARLLDLAAELDIDLWTLDALWWGIDEPVVEEGEGEGHGEDDVSQAFGLERHLQNFMYDNWGRIPLGQQWDLYEQDGEIVGYEYNTNEIGKIDLLAKHKTKPRWLVIELKRGQTSDETVGQVLRYMGWVEENLAEDGDSVHGLIIAREPLRPADQRGRKQLPRLFPHRRRAAIDWHGMNRLAQHVNPEAHRPRDPGRLRIALAWPSRRRPLGACFGKRAASSRSHGGRGRSGPIVRRFPRFETGQRMHGLLPRPAWCCACRRTSRATV
jgi:hypothetical protein